MAFSLECFGAAPTANGRGLGAGSAARSVAYAVMALYSYGLYSYDLYSYGLCCDNSVSVYLLQPPCAGRAVSKHCMHHNYLGHNYIGRSHTGRNCTGHNCTGHHNIGHTLDTLCGQRAVTNTGTIPSMYESVSQFYSASMYQSVGQFYSTSMYQSVSQFHSTSM